MTTKQKKQRNYPDTALCMQPGFPKRDWTECRIEDRDGDLETCQYCGVQKIRFVHVLEHPLWPVHVSVGCVCVETLTGESRASVKKRERAVAYQTQKRKAERQRREAFARQADQTRWITLSDEHLKCPEPDCALIVFPTKGMMGRINYWRYRLDGVEAGEFSNKYAAMRAGAQAWAEAA